MKKYYAFFIISLITLITTVLSAEDAVQKKSFGLTASTSADYSTAGFIYNFSKSAALRPAVGIYQVDNFIKEYSLLADLLLFLKEDNNFSIYYGPGLGISYSSEQYKYKNGDRSKTTSNSITLSAVIGAQYMLSDRFGFFADTGLQLTRIKRKLEEYDYSSDTDYNAEETDNVIKLRTASIGAIFYFF